MSSGNPLLSNLEHVSRFQQALILTTAPFRFLSPIPITTGSSTPDMLDLNNGVEPQGGSITSPSPSTSYLPDAGFQSPASPAMHRMLHTASGRLSTSPSTIDRLRRPTRRSPGQDRESQVLGITILGARGVGVRDVW
ncbi:hypothetical protein NMY22_g18815 [Coprinellus aureogranulatus]|nr:hypothetical protein NMY22_g18815 [Coprinellus aureogranulatus]